MNAELKDFHINYENKEAIGWRFRLGKCDDFYVTMHTFKNRIHLSERTPHVEANWLWEVKATAQNKNAMAQIFNNFEQCLEIAESQLRMF